MTELSAAEVAEYAIMHARCQAQAAQKSAAHLVDAVRFLTRLTPGHTLTDGSGTAWSRLENGMWINRRHEVITCRELAYRLATAQIRGGVS